MATIAIDMDGTIADFTTKSFEKVKELYGIKLTKDDAYKPKTAELVWERMTDQQKNKYENKNEIYGEICSAGFFLSLKPFDGAIEGVKHLAEDGHEIVFLTKPLNWDRSAPEKAKWLKKHFPDLDYTIIMVDSVKAKHLIDVDVLVDDDSRVLEGVELAVPICIAQPWNEKDRDKYVIVAESFANAVEMIRKVCKGTDSWEEMK